MPKYSKALAGRICQRISMGESLNKICKNDDYPHYSTVMDWLCSSSERYNDFKIKYAKARELQADFFVDSMFEMIEEEEDAQFARIKMDALKWQAGKLRPKKYGEKSQTDHVSSDGSMTPTKIIREIID